MAFLSRMHFHAMVVVFAIATSFAESAHSGDDAGGARDAAILECLKKGTRADECTDRKPYEFDSTYFSQTNPTIQFGDVQFLLPSLKGPSAAEIFLQQLHAPRVASSQPPFVFSLDEGTADLYLHHWKGPAGTGSIYKRLPDRM